MALNLFRQYIKKRKFEEDELISSKVKLAAVLRKFYAEARKKNGDLYSKASLVGKKNIIKDPEFVEANVVYQAEIAQLKREGKARTPITNDKTIVELDFAKYRDLSVSRMQINNLPLPSASGNN